MKRFFSYGCMVIDMENIIPSTIWQFKHQQKKYCDELNKINEENKKLKERLVLEKKLSYENEQLKSTINAVTELLVKEVDVFSDKATEHDINAYLELKELDNKDAYYMAIATKEAIKMLKELIMDE